MTQKKVNQHAEFVEKILPQKNRFFTALYGSQNYNMNLPTSDVDTKTIVLPTNLRDVVISPFFDTKTYTDGPEDGQAVILDFEHFRKNLHSGSTEILEVLFTNYVNINNDFIYYFKELKSNREKIARMDMTRRLYAELGQLNQCIHRYKTNGNLKALAHGVRHQELIMRYFVHEEPFEKCLKTEQRDYLLDIRQGKFAPSVPQDLEDWARDFKEYTFPNLANNFSIDTTTQRWLEFFMVDIYKKILWEEFV